MEEMGRGGVLDDGLKNLNPSYTWLAPVLKYPRASESSPSKSSGGTVLSTGAFQSGPFSPASVDPRPRRLDSRSGHMSGSGLNL